MLWQCIAIFLFIIINGVFAMAEIVIVSSRKTRLQQWANEGNVKARIALKLAKEPTHFLSTVQAGITLFGIMIGALGEAALAHRLAEKLSGIGALAPYSKIIGFIIVVLCITFVSLIVGELVPKRLGLYCPERLALVLAPFLRMFSRIASPVVKILSVTTDSILGVLRLAGIRQPDESSITEEEIKVMIEQGTLTGVFEETEQGIIERVFRLNDRHVGSLMVPRTNIVWLDINDTPAEIRSILGDNTFSRFPVCAGNLDRIAGIVHVKFLVGSADLPVDIRRHMRAPIFVPKEMRALKVLELFKKTGMHLAIVIDEYGSVLGLVSIDDILQAIIGDIAPIDGQEIDYQVNRLEDGSWLMDGMLPIEKFKVIVGVNKLPDEERFRTLGGFVMTYTGSVPSVGDHFVWDGLRVEVTKMDGNRVDKVLVGKKEVTG